MASCSSSVGGGMGDTGVIGGGIVTATSSLTLPSLDQAASNEGAAKAHRRLTGVPANLVGKSVDNVETNKVLKHVTWHVHGVGDKTLTQ